MIHNIYRLRKVLNFIYQYLFTCLFIVFACSIIIHVPFQYVYFAELFIIYTISYISRDFSPNLLIALIFHVLPLLGIYLYGIGQAVFIVMVLIGFYLLTDTWVYMRMGRILKPVDDMPWPVFLMSVIFFLFGYYVNDSMLKNAAYLIPLICIAIYLLNVYLDGLTKYVNATKNVSGLPMKNIVKTNSVFVSSIIALLLVVVVLCSSIDFRAALTFIKNGIVSVIKIFFSGFAFIINLIMKLFQEEAAEGTDGMYVPNNPTRENNFAAGENIIAFLKIILIIALIYIVVRITIKIIKALIVKQQRMLDIVDVAEAEKNLTVETTGKKGIFHVLFSPEEKLRKMYKKYILGYSYDIKLKKSSTCGEIQREIMESSNEDLSALTKLYSDVRYGGKTADRDDLKKIKQLTSKR